MKLINVVCVFVVCVCVAVSAAAADATAPDDCYFNEYDSGKLLCSNMSSLYNISKDTARNIKSLYVFSCSNHRITKNILKLLPEVTKFQVECQFESLEINDSLVIEKESFQNATNLMDISMEDNQIASIPTGEFCDLDQLKWLSLRRNRLNNSDMLGLSGNCEVTCGQSLENLDLDNNRLEIIKNNSFLCRLHNLKRLNLNDNSIKTIEINAFANMSSLTGLFLLNNSLSELDENIFQNTPLLEQLSLSVNKLKVVDKLFRNLRNLEDLTLKYNKIENLASDTFRDLTKLHNLYLGHNDISKIPNGLFRTLDYLDFLYLNNNRLSKLEADTFSGLSQLSYLNLDDNVIDSVSENTFDQVPNLMWLYVRNNRLTRIPSLLSLTILTELYLTNNTIETLPPITFVNTSSLELLHLNENNIAIVHNLTFQNLTSLKSLNLAHNKITTIEEDTFEGLDNLQSLQLEYNFLNFTANIHKETYYREVHLFTSLSKLNSLDLSNNLIPEYHYGWWPHSLENLNLSHNFITELHMDGVALPASIRNVDVRYNLLERIQNSRFPRNTERIFLSHNRLTTIDEDAFEDNTALRLVTLDNNRLQSLQLLPPKFERDIGIVKLHLSQNPWSCDCHLTWLKEIVDGVHSSYFIEDSQKLQCRRRYHRNRKILIPLYKADSYEDFMCTFHKNDTELCLKWYSMDDTICKHVCPEECTCYRGAKWEVINVDCTGKNLTNIPRNLHPVTLSLFLDKNNITSIRKGDLPRFGDIREINLNDNSLVFIEDGSFEHMDTLESLFLESNLLRSLSPDLFVNLTKLTVLDLSHNLLSNLSDRLFRSLHSLEKLYLNDNKLHYFPVWTLHKLDSLSSIGLYNNPWSCDCDYAASYITWMRDFARKLLNSDEIYCLTEQGKKISYIAFNDSLCFNGTTTGVLNEHQVAALISTLVFLVVVTILSLLVFIYRREMQVIIYSRYGVRLFHNVEEEEHNKLYDAFVSYSSLDEEFVVRQFLPGLEGIDNPYKVCLHHRDFPIGAFINESIFDAIDKSRRTILILSQNFVQSEWCRFEFRTAHSQMLQDRRNRVIVIILGKIPKQLDPAMRLYLRTNTYLCWDDKLFWQKLYFAMPEKKYEFNDEEEHVL